MKDVLSEIEAEIENNCQATANSYSSAGCIIIAAQDDRMCSQIQDVRLNLCNLLFDFSMMIFYISERVLICAVGDDSLLTLTLMFYH